MLEIVRTFTLTRQPGIQKELLLLKNSYQTSMSLQLLLNGKTCMSKQSSILKEVCTETLH